MLALRFGIVSAMHAWSIGLLVIFGTGRGLAADAAPRAWSPALLRDAGAWPHSEKDAQITVTPNGLRIGVPEGRTYAIAAASRLLLPGDMGRILIGDVVVKWNVPRPVAKP